MATDPRATAAVATLGDLNLVDQAIVLSAAATAAQRNHADPARAQIVLRVLDDRSIGGPTATLYIGMFENACAWLVNERFADGTFPAPTYDDCCKRRLTVQRWDQEARRFRRLERDERAIFDDQMIRAVVAWQGARA